MPVVTKIYLLLFICVFLSAQGIPYNQEFQVNTYTNSNQVGPAVCGLANGGFVVCWQSNSQDGSESGIFGQLFGPDGSKKGNEFQVNTYTEFNQERPDTDKLLDGGFVVCWSSSEQGDASIKDISAQIFNSDGSKRSQEFQVNTYSTNNQGFPSISHLDSGGFIICWQSFGQDGSRNGVYGQLFYNDGSKNGPEFQVNTHVNDDQLYPSVSKLTGNGFVICWTSYFQDDSGAGIFGQLFNSDGSKRGQEFQANSKTFDDQNFPDVNFLNDGGFIVSWSSRGDKRQFDIFAQIFKSDGSKQGAEFRVNKHIDNHQWYSKICHLKNGRSVICWISSGQDGSDEGIYCQALNSDGSKQGLEFRVNTYYLYEQLSPAISFLENGGVIICWDSNYQDGSGFGVYGRYYLEDINHPLTAFSLSEPANDNTLYEFNHHFKWQQASNIPLNLPWELRYTLFLDTNESFILPTIIDSIYDVNCLIQNLEPGTRYFWKVLAENIAGDSLWSSQTNAFFVDWHATTGFEKITSQKPQSYLHQNYPNPFNPQTIITYELNSRNFVKLTVFNITGREVTTLVNEEHPAGAYSIIFNSDNLASGVYYYHIQAGSYQETKKMLLVR